MRLPLGGPGGLEGLRVALRVAPLVSLLLAPAASADDEKRRLEEIRTEIEEREEKARAYAEEAEGYVGEIDAIDRQLVEARSSVRVLERRRRAAQKELRGSRAALDEARAALAETRRVLTTRLVSLYKSRAAAGIPALYTARDVQGFARRREALARIVAHDRDLFARHRAALARVEEARAEGAALVAELGAAAEQVALREDRIRRTLVERKNLIELLRSRADREQRAAEELRRAAERLEKALRSLPADRRAPAGDGLVRGAVPAPVEGSVRLGFGRQVDSRYGTETLRNGLELAAEPGARVRAVASGRTMFAGWFRGYGRIVILDHGHGHVTVSGFLDEMAVGAGDAVTGGQVIGTVGETGPIAGPGLYFEIRVNGKPVDPGSWLEPERARVRAGTGRTRGNP